ncbi:MAG: hypothetical protein GX635_01310 [Synergistaceae bacterium]|nr:hypothetical protein [Synergistaceae bacterium]
MEKKIARIYRWLERCAKACSAGSWNSALLDMECAKAELEDVRTEIWSKTEGAFGVRPTRRGALALKASFLSVVLLFSLAAPLAIQSSRPASSVYQASGNVHSGEHVLEWVTGDEQAVLAALRKSLSDANRAWSAAAFRGETDAVAGESASAPAMDEDPVAEEKTYVARAPSASEGSGASRESGAETVSRRVRPKAQGELAAGSAGLKNEVVAGEDAIRPSSVANELDSIISLVQIGQKALRERESPIQFQRP